MLLTLALLKGVKAGDISLAFRRWPKPRVKAGGQFKSAVGVIGITAIKCVAPGSITAADAKRAGFASRDDVLAFLNTRRDGDIYKISLRYVGTDPRLALRAKTTLSKTDRAAVTARLERLDQASRTGAWTMQLLRLIAKHPGRRAADVAVLMNMETQAFKRNVRKLKTLGLTISLEVGYHLSPRGRALMKSPR